jgi:hypothetical protein
VDFDDVTLGRRLTIVAGEVTESLGPQALILLLLPFLIWVARRRPQPGSLKETWLLLGALLVACGWFAICCRIAVDQSLSLHRNDQAWGFEYGIIKPMILTAAGFIALLVPMLFARRTSLALIGVAPLMVLLAGLGVYAFELGTSFPHHTMCGVRSLEFVVDAREVAAQDLVLRAVTWAAISLMALGLAGGLLLRSSPTTGGLRPRVVALGLALLTASALLVGEALPFYAEAQLVPLPLQDEPRPLANGRLSLPPERGPTSLRVDVFPLQLGAGRTSIQYSRHEPPVSAAPAELSETLNRLRSEDPFFRGAQSTVVLLADPGLPSSEFSAPLRHLPPWIESVQLAFDQPRFVHRPLLGTFRITNETGLELPLRPVEGSRPLHLLEDETWGAFARRALDEHQKGPVHLVVSD